MTVKTCDVSGCTGHIDKFINCINEAVYVASLDGFGEVTGSVEWRVHVTLLTFTPEDNKLRTGDYGTHAGRTVEVPPGTYLITENDRGTVVVNRFEDPQFARERFEKFDAEYAAWLGDED